MAKRSRNELVALQPLSTEESVSAILAHVSRSSRAHDLGGNIAARLCREVAGRLDIPVDFVAADIWTTEAEDNSDAFIAVNTALDESMVTTSGSGAPVLPNVLADSGFRSTPTVLARHETTVLVPQLCSSLNDSRASLLWHLLDRRRCEAFVSVAETDGDRPWESDPSFASTTDTAAEASRIVRAIRRRESGSDITAARPVTPATIQELASIAELLSSVTEVGAEANRLQLDEAPSWMHEVVAFLRTVGSGDALACAAQLMEEIGAEVVWADIEIGTPDKDQSASEAVEASLARRVLIVDDASVLVPELALAGALPEELDAASVDGEVIEFRTGVVGRISVLSNDGIVDAPAAHLKASIHEIAARIAGEPLKEPSWSEAPSPWRSVYRLRGRTRVRLPAGTIAALVERWLRRRLGDVDIRLRDSRRIAIDELTNVELYAADGMEFVSVIEQRGDLAIRTTIAHCGRWIGVTVAELSGRIMNPRPPALVLALMREVDVLDGTAEERRIESGVWTVAPSQLPELAALLVDEARIAPVVLVCLPSDRRDVVLGQALRLAQHLAGTATVAALRRGHLSAVARAVGSRSAGLDPPADGLARIVGRISDTVDQRISSELGWLHPGELSAEVDRMYARSTAPDKHIAMLASLGVPVDAAVAVVLSGAIEHFCAPTTMPSDDLVPLAELVGDETFRRVAEQFAGADFSVEHRLLDEVRETPEAERGATHTPWIGESVGPMAIDDQDDSIADNTESDAEGDDFDERVDEPEDSDVSTAPLAGDEPPTAAEVLEQPTVGERVDPVDDEIPPRIAPAPPTMDTPTLSSLEPMLDILHDRLAHILPSVIEPLVIGAFDRALTARAQESSDIDQLRRELTDANDLLKMSEEETSILQEALTKTTSELHTLEQKLFAAQDRAVIAERALRGVRVTQPAVSSGEPPTTFAELVERARSLPHIAMGGDTVEQAQRLDRHGNGRHVSRAWEALLSLAAFARDAVDHDYAGDYRHWCAASGSPFVLATTRVAMTESETVTTDPRLRAERLFAISDEVGEGAHMMMKAHIKIAQDGVAPRLYFHDDTMGRTGSIHIGALLEHPTTTRS